MLSLPKTINSRLAKEFRFVADQINNTDSPYTKVYLFSAFFGELQRTLNWHWDTGLLLCHQVTQQAHQQMAGRMSAVAQGNERPIGFPDGYFEQVDLISNQLADLFERLPVDETQFIDVLLKVAVLGYAATGNGNYLSLKGELQF